MSEITVLDLVQSLNRTISIKKKLFWFKSTVKNKKKL